MLCNILVVKMDVLCILEDCYSNELRIENLSLQLRLQLGFGEIVLVIPIAIAIERKDLFSEACIPIRLSILKLSWNLLMTTW